MRHQARLLVAGVLLALASLAAFSVCILSQGTQAAAVWGLWAAAAGLAALCCLVAATAR